MYILLNLSSDFIKRKFLSGKYILSHRQISTNFSTSNQSMSKYTDIFQNSDTYVCSTELFPYHVMTNWDEIVFERAYSLILFKKSTLLALILRHFIGKQHKILPTPLSNFKKNSSLHVYSSLKLFIGELRVQKLRSCLLKNQMMLLQK